MAAQFMKGALISFMPTFLGALPNAIIFQMNPETITHTWTAGADASSGDGKAGQDPLAVKSLPGETFAFTISLDANDMIADGDVNPIAAGIATLSGVYARLAALEMLQYPIAAPGPPLVGAGAAAAAAAATGGSADGSQNETVPRLQVPVVLFAWGPERIVPVRVTALTITEKLYDVALNPTHAEAQMTLKVLTLDDLVNVQGVMKDIATAAYTYTQGLRQVQAMANLGDAAASVLGMLPTPF
jgi:hypothetical protein